MERKIVIPGEMIIEGEDYLPGENTEKRDGKVYSSRYGLAEEQSNLVKVIPLSGVYHPRRGNAVIGKVENVLANGWIIDIGAADSAFLSLMEVPRYVNKDAMEEVLTIDDMVTAKIWSINKRGIDLSLKGRGFGKIEEGLIFNVNSNKVPRIIGKEGSMIKIIKENTGCDITVGQNGTVLVEGNKIEDELFAKKAIMYIAERSFISGLTDLVTKWFTEQGNKK
ncbi:MAG: exosome complex RNA-binding protein Rrp4 [Nanoarchaeota archaeon]|jgi:exosome complex component RRP4|nr:exosome complex RNA-binding protein Rrp4 [Nanoarchaeota archaeon]